ncbi:VOC family protein [Streptomyces sp. NPDC056600]|uniref:VOC family protein n=1 Tax=Streptomyces sp. NPDC056600 TaxID=3345874 RepID=UPI0036AEE509
MTDETGAADVNDFSTTGRAPGAPGAPCWTSLRTHGLGVAHDFYGPLLGWEFTPGKGGPLRELIATAQGRPVAGIGLLPDDARLTAEWTPFLTAEDIDRAALAVRQCGGTMGVGPLDDAEGGRVAFCSDPAGAVFGMRRLPRSYPPPAPGLPGTPAWLELVVAETRFAVRFYQSVFGLGRETAPSPAEERVVLRHAGRPVLGIRGAGLSVHRAGGAHWLTYFATPDVDRATEHAVALGGRISRPPTNGLNGRSAQLTDPDGAPFGLLTPAATRAERDTAGARGTRVSSA